MANKFPGKCECGAQVGAGTGSCSKSGGRWVIKCAKCIGAVALPPQYEDYDNASIWTDADLIAQLAALSNIIDNPAQFPKANIDRVYANWEACHEALSMRPLTVGVLAALTGGKGLRALASA